MIRARAQQRGARRILKTAAMLAAILGTRVGVPPASGASLRLTDGRVLEGRDVRREGDLYILVLEGDTVVPIPASLVAEVGISASPQPAPVPPPTSPPVPGLTYPEPQTLAGVPVTPPITSEQLAVFGEPAKFQQDIVRSTLEPTYWVMDPAQNNWNPSKWAKAPTDPNWQPTSAYDMNKDVLADSRSNWAKAPTDSTWVPQDGFKKSSSWP